MNLRIGNMWDYQSEYEVVLVTTNSDINRKGELVMGAGAAEELKTRYPEYPKLFAQEIAGKPIYGVCVLGRLGIFQVKYHYSEKAKLELVAYSCGALSELAQSGFADDFALNFPGIGLGKLSPKLVLPFVQTLPQNVDVWVRSAEELE
jgi:hypothetical protein